MRYLGLPGEAGLAVVTGMLLNFYAAIGIIIPLMVAISLLTDAHLLDRAVGFFQPVMRRLDLSTRLAFPLLAGLFWGLSLVRVLSYRLPMMAP